MHLQQQYDSILLLQMQQINFVTIKNGRMKKEKHYIDSIYYQLELTARYCKYLGSQLVEKIGMPLSLDEVVKFSETCEKMQKTINALKENYFFKKKYNKKNDNLYE